MPDRTLYADLTPVAVHRSTPRTAPARPVQRPHTSLASTARDQATVTRAVSRLAHAGRSVKPITFNACL